MIKILILILIANIALANNNTNTLYDLINGEIYIHLTNNDLISLKFNIDGTDDSINNNEAVNNLVSPPDTSDLFLFNSSLYGFRNNSGDLDLIKYDKSTDKWASITLDFDAINDKSYYKSSNYLTSPSSHEIYIYGGNKDNEITDRLLSLDFSNCKLSNISTSTKPQPFYGSGNILVTPTTQLLIGGQSSQGWLNMYQLATWDFTSGWSFNSVDKDNSTLVNSRKFPNLLPIFNPLKNSSLSTILADYKVNKILMMGGVDDENNLSTPQLSTLVIESNNWYFESSAKFNTTNYLGFATIFDNFIAISHNNDISNKRDDSQYQLDLYDLNFNKISKLNIPKSQEEIAEQTENDKNSVELKAILGTIIPISSVIVIIIIGYFIMKKKKKERLQKELNDLNYHYENYFNIEEKQKQKEKRHENINLLYNDSSSTLDIHSIDSWVRKRQEYDNDNNDSSNLNDNPFMQSQETLNDDDKFEIRSPEPLKTIHKLNRSMIKLRKSMSFNNLSPSKYSHNLLPDNESQIENQYPVKIEESNIVEEYNDLDYESENEMNHKSSGKVSNGGEFYDDEVDTDSAFDKSVANIDVQVLVSSKRRGTLKVMNPDSSSVEESSIRQRTASNEIKYD